MIRVLVLTTLLAVVPVLAQAQQPRFEVHASAAASRVFRAEDESFGTVPSAGAGLEWRVLSRLGVGVEGSLIRGLTPKTLECHPPAGVTCTGSAREGVLSVDVASFTGAVYFGKDPRVQPYVIGGLGIVRSHSVSSLTTARGAIWTIEEFEKRDTGTGLTAGAGLHFTIGERMVLRPEWRMHDGSLLGRANLAVMRTSVAFGYAW